MIIAFTGKIGSGKDTAGERMTHIVDLPCRRVSFAAPLKESAAALLDIPTEAWEQYKNDADAKVLLQVGWGECEVVYDHDDNGNPLVGPGEFPNIIREFTAREFLQRYGTESHRQVFGDNFWAEQAEKKLHGDGAELVYVTDARFSNEAEVIKANGGVIVKVWGENDDTGGHVSEAGLPTQYIDYVIDNSVRGDNFANLDKYLRALAVELGLPVKDVALT